MTAELRITEITGYILEEQSELSLADLCRACAAEAARAVTASPCTPRDHSPART